MQSRKDQFRCIILDNTVLLEPHVYFSPQSYGLQRRKHFFQKKFPEYNIVWVSNEDEWGSYCKRYLIKTFILRDGSLEEQ